MDLTHDIALVLGLGAAIFVLPLALAAWSDGRPQRLAPALAGISALLIGWALLSAPSGYGLTTMGEAVFRVLALILP